MEISKYSGYYCQNCNLIPLIQIIPQKSNIKIFSSCKCHKKYQNIETFIKKNYKKDIVDINKISKESIINEYSKYKNNKEENKIDINSIIDKLNKTKGKIRKEGIEIKDSIIEIYQRKINEINKIYDKYIEKNNNIILVIEQMIKSYQLISDNQSNIHNLLNNCSFNDKSKSKSLLKNYITLDSLFKNVENYFNEEFIIVNSSKSEGFENKYLFFSNYSVRSFIELDKGICASCSNNQSNINLYDLNDLNNDKYSFKAHLKNVTWIIKSNKNNIISCGDDGLIKIWPKITNNFLLKMKANIPEEKDSKTYKTKKVNEFSLNPLYEAKFAHKDIIKINKMINLKEDQFIAYTNNTIFIFRYAIDEDKNNIQIDLIKDYVPKYIIKDICVVEKGQNKIIALYNDYFLIFLDINNFDIINKLNIKSMTPNSLIQLNQNDLLFQEGNYFRIFDINKFKSKLIVKNYSTNDFLMNMNDGTIIQSNYSGIKRYLIKTMEELPNLIQLNNDDDDYYYDYYNSYDSYVEKITYMLKLKDGRVITCYQNGRIEICSLKFI